MERQCVQKFFTYLSLIRNNFSFRDSQTDGLLLEGAHQWTPIMYIKLVQDVGVDSIVAQHLSETYGDRAFAVTRYDFT